MTEQPPGTFEICPVCNWEDDNVQAAHPAMSGGANRMSLDQARHNFALFSAVSEAAVRRVRRPLPEEIPE